MTSPDASRTPRVATVVGALDDLGLGELLLEAGADEGPEARAPAVAGLAERRDDGDQARTCFASQAARASGSQLCVQ